MLSEMSQEERVRYKIIALVYTAREQQRTKDDTIEPHNWGAGRSLKEKSEKKERKES